MKAITRIEETILLAVWRIKEDAYGVMIQEQIEKSSGREYLYSTLYTTLEQLVRKGYIHKHFGEPSAKRGGKRKIFFEISDLGLEVLKETFVQQQSTWNGISEESFKAGN